jgi:hypothetical protein
MRDIVLVGLVALGMVVVTDARAQVQIDINDNQARQAAGRTYLEDLAIHDTALIYTGSLCVKDGAIYVPNWVEPANLANGTYTSTGIIAKSEVLPGRRLKILLVDERQAQLQALGRVGEKSDMTKEDYNKQVRDFIHGMFVGDWLKHPLIFIS